MKKNDSILFNFGEALIILGCLLPWRIEGDVIHYVYYGIQIEITKANLFFHDAGGGIVLFSAMFLFLLIKTHFIKNRFTVAKIVSIGTLAFVLFKILEVLLYQSQNLTTDIHTIGVGLIMVFIGESFILWFVLRTMHFSTEKQFPQR